MTGAFRRVDTSSAKTDSADELFRDLLPRTGVALLVGPSGVGKSFFALMLAASIATGVSIAGDAGAVAGRPLQRGSTVYVAGEGVAGVRSRLSAYNSVYLGSGQPSQLPIMLYELGDARLSGDHSMDLKMAVTKEREGTDHASTPVRLVVFDTLIATFSVRDENSNAEMQSVLDLLRAHASRFDCLVVATVHPGKGRGARRQGVRGASATFNGADAVLSLTKLQDGRRRLSIAKMRDADTGRRSLDFVIEPVGASAVMRPSASFDTNGHQQPEPVYAKDMAEVLRRSWAASSLSLENFLGQNVPAATLPEIVQAYVALDAERAALDRHHVSKRDTLRKRVERHLSELTEAAYVDKQQHNGTYYYVSC